jgi:hypothetical protein
MMSESLIRSFVQLKTLNLFASCIRCPSRCAGGTPAASLAILPRRPGFGLGCRFAAGGAKLCGHPFLRAHNALKQTGDIRVGVQSGPVEAETGALDLDRLEVVSACILQALG